MSKLNDGIRAMFTIGSPLCGLVYAALAVVIAVLLLLIGLWKTLFILVFTLAGALLGGIAHKKDALRRAINARFPAKDAPIKNHEEPKERETAD